MKYDQVSYTYAMRRTLAKDYGSHEDQFIEEWSAKHRDLHLVIAELMKPNKDNEFADGIDELVQVYRRLNRREFIFEYDESLELVAESIMKCTRERLNKQVRDETHQALERGMKSLLALLRIPEVGVLVRENVRDAIVHVSHGMILARQVLIGRQGGRRKGGLGMKDSWDMGRVHCSRPRGTKSEDAVIDLAKQQK